MSLSLYLCYSLLVYNFQGLHLCVCLYMCAHLCVCLFFCWSCQVIILPIICQKGHICPGQNCGALKSKVNSLTEWQAPDMIFVKIFTQPDFQAKNFTAVKYVNCDLFTHDL